MPDHVHLVLTPLMRETGEFHLLGAILKGIKGTSARRVNRLMGRSGSLWLPESFDHLLRRDESAEAKCDYVCRNPLRKGLARSPEEYRWLWRLSVPGEP